MSISLAHPRRLVIVSAVGAALISLALGGVRLGPAVARELCSRLGRQTVESRVSELSPRVGPIWMSRCASAGVVYPPARVTLVVLKREREVRVYGPSDTGWAILARYPILAASGTIGPKLREGDGQVPEGVYRVESLNPNSRFHLALRVDYPSEADRLAAASDGRTGLGGDIMIHGGSASVGCVALGDPAIEEVFTIAAVVGIERVELLFCPSVEPASHVHDGISGWTAERYRALSRKLAELSGGEEND